jgi:hypothetical protein
VPGTKVGATVLAEAPASQRRQQQSSSSSSSSSSNIGGNGQLSAFGSVCNPNVAGVHDVVPRGLL